MTSAARATLVEAEDELQAALEHTDACRDRYDSAIGRDAVARYELQLNAAYDAEQQARDRLATARVLAPEPIRLRRPRGVVL